MERSRKRPDSSSAESPGLKGRRVRQPIEERSPNNQAAGEYDPDDAYGWGPIPVGHAPVRPQRAGPSIPVGVVVEQDSVGNPGDVPNTDDRKLDEEASRETRQPEKPVKKASP
ncbi:MAG TPA: hypothetical protein VJ746_03695 [Nitrospira sp.]|nr:hypothetical protein [Nitrospira sp.]